MDGVSASAAEKKVTPFIYHKTEMKGCAKSAHGSMHPGLTTKAGTPGTTVTGPSGLRAPGTPDTPTTGERTLEEAFRAPVRRGTAKTGAKARTIGAAHKTAAANQPQKGPLHADFALFDTCH